MLFLYPILVLLSLFKRLNVLFSAWCFFGSALLSLDLVVPLYHTHYSSNMELHILFYFFHPPILYCSFLELDSS